MINHQLLLDIYRLRKGDEQYCFPLRRFLGPNGLYENHELKGEIFVRKEDGEEFVVENVYVHYYEGYYYVALAKNKYNSHCCIHWNINSEMDIENINNYYKKDLKSSDLTHF